MHRNDRKPKRTLSLSLFKNNKKKPLSNEEYVNKLESIQANNKLSFFEKNRAEQTVLNQRIEDILFNKMNHLHLQDSDSSEEVYIHSKRK